MSPGSPSTPPRPRAKRVSAQHTRDRVRNNQRRHRARRKDYIATLEEKLGEAEQTISSLRGKIEALESELTTYRRCQNDHDGADCCTPLETHQSSSVVSTTDVLGYWKPPVPVSTYPLVSYDLSGLELDALISPPDESLQSLISIAQPSELVARPLLAMGSASTSSLPKHALTAASPQAVAEAGSLLPETAITDLVLSPTTPCCSNEPPSGAQPSASTANRTALVSSQEASLPMPAYLVEPAMEANYQEEASNESTMLCSEAYTLIAQGNFKGISDGDVATWLWTGFRRSLQPGGGCRVNTDMLFSLLAFISDA